MKLNLTQTQREALRRFLESCEDAEKLSEREYVVDLYDIEKPLSLDLVWGRDTVSADGAALLLYDEEQDGWYMDRRVEDAGDVVAALVEAGAILP